MGSENLAIIQDPVHGPIRLTAIEQAIVNRPAFQRLRFVGQQGMVSLTFPASVHSRFQHTLGTMHLAGRMLVSAIQNAEEPARREFVSAGRRLIEAVASFAKVDTKALETEFGEFLGNASGCDDAALLGSLEDRLTINVLWQAVRVAALIHDIGHLPLSHTFEHAIWAVRREHPDPDEIADGEPRHAFILAIEAVHRRFEDIYRRHITAIAGRPVNAKVRVDLHEQLGVLFADQLLRQSGAAVAATGLSRLILSIGFLAFVIEGPDPGGPPDVPDEERLLRALHCIVSGQIDADRLDYSTRDPASSAVGVGTIDVAAIVGNLEFVLAGQPGLNRKGAHNGPPILVALRPRAILAAEMFFAHRFFGYRSIVDDHNVWRFNAIAEHVLIDLLEESTEAASILQPVLCDFRFAGFNEQSYQCWLFGFEDFQDRDDGWLRTLLGRVLRTLAAAGRTLTSRQLRLKLLIETLLYRKTENMISVFKTQLDYTIGEEQLGSAVGSKSASRVFTTDFADSDPSNLFRDEFLPALNREMQKIFASGTPWVPIVKCGRPRVPPRWEPPTIRIPVRAPNGIRDLVAISPFLQALANVGEKLPRLQLAVISSGAKGVEGSIKAGVAMALAAWGGRMAPPTTGEPCG